MPSRKPAPKTLPLDATPDHHEAAAPVDATPTADAAPTDPGAQPDPVPEGRILATMSHPESPDPTGASTSPSDEDAFLAAGTDDLPGRFEVLAAASLRAEQGAIIDARRTLNDALSDVEQASAELPALEQAFLKSKSDDAHARFDAARSRLAKARDLETLARRDLAAKEAALQDARGRLARRLLDALWPRLDKSALLDDLAPSVDRLEGMLRQLTEEVAGIVGKVRQRGQRVTLAYQLASLAGVDLAKMSRDPRYAVALDGYGTFRGLSEDDAMHFIRQQLTERAKKARFPEGLLFWLTPWGW
jgi:hypothetical protein